MYTPLYTNRTREQGFTLIEILVSTTIFTAVMLIAVGTLLSMVDANRKAQSLKSAVNNLSFSLDGMARTIRNGSNVHCGTIGAISVATDCPNLTAGGNTYLAVEKYGGDLTNDADQYVYCRGDATTGACDAGGNAILRSTTGGAAGTFLPLTSPEVTITDLRFAVIGAVRSESPKTQPRITIIMRGFAGSNNRVRTEIKLQTTITARLFDE